MYCGGTWQGIIKHLDYIQGMGFTAVWISPIVEQVPGSSYVGESYHGYWPRNLYAFEARFGTEHDFRSLVDAIHARGMRLMLDIVLNHFVANAGDLVHSEIYLCLRVLLCRVGEEHLSSFWPVILTEMVRCGAVSGLGSSS